MRAEGMFPPGRGWRGLPGAARGLSVRVRWTGGLRTSLRRLRLAGTAGKPPSMTKKELFERLEKIPDDKVVYVYKKGAIRELVIDGDGDVVILTWDD